MAIKFEFYESPNTIGTRKKRYHARVVNWQRINTDYLAREIQYGSSLTVADIKATIISLSEKLAYYLKDGARVHIEGIGYFHISLTCPETRTPSSTRANKVKFKSVTFRADKYLKHQLKVFFQSDSIGVFVRELYIYGNFPSLPLSLTVEGDCI
jgi:predicted histone-like DNA-binding protein